MRRRAIERALREGDLTRIREGVYVDGTDAEVIAAVRCGGTVSCGAALRRAGVWVARRGLHVRVDPDTRVHGRATRIHRVSGVASDGVDTVLTALRIACDGLPRDEAGCAIDSCSIAASPVCLHSPRSCRVPELARHWSVQTVAANRESRH